MFYEEPLNFLRKILEKCSIKNYVLSAEESIETLVAQELKSVFGSQNYARSFYDMFPELRPNIIYRMSDVLHCRYLFFELPLTEPKQVFVMGPYLNDEWTTDSILEWVEAARLPQTAVKHLQSFYEKIPIIKEEHHILAVVFSFAENLWNGDRNFECVDVGDKGSVAFLPIQNPNFEVPDGADVDMQIIENRYDFENELMTAVSHGNLAKAQLMLSRFSSLAFENRVADPLRNAKNYCIVMNTLLRKAAQQGGVHPVYIDSISSDFARRIEALHTLSRLSDLMSEILRGYCNLVKYHSIQKYSLPVQKAILKVQSDLTGDLSLRTVARQNNVSAGYFSNLFSKETGQSFTEYVNQKRVEYAKHLLKSTNLQIQTVAQHCGVLDLHYFCRLFKKQVGKTPSEYRNRHHL